MTTLSLDYGMNKCVQIFYHRRINNHLRSYKFPTNDCKLSNKRFSLNTVLNLNTNIKRPAMDVSIEHNSMVQPRGRQR